MGKQLSVFSKFFEITMSSQTGSMSVQQADILTELSVQAVQQAGTYRKQQILAKTDPVPMDGGNGDCSGITCSAKAFCCPCCITGDVAAHVGSESCAMCCVSGCCIFMGNQGCCHACTVGAELRHQNDIKYNLCANACCACWFPCCALAKDAKYVNKIKAHRAATGEASAPQRQSMGH